MNGYNKLSEYEWLWLWMNKGKYRWVTDDDRKVVIYGIHVRRLLLTTSALTCDRQHSSHDACCVPSRAVPVGRVPILGANSGDHASTTIIYQLEIERKEAVLNRIRVKACDMNTKIWVLTIWLNTTSKSQSTFKITHSSWVYFLTYIAGEQPVRLIIQFYVLFG